MDAEIVVIATMRNAVAPNNNLPDGQTELVLGDVVKPHDAIKDRKFIVTQRHIVSNDTYLVAIDVFKGNLDPYLGTPLDAKGAIVKYVRGGLQLKDKTPIGRLRYNLDFLGDECKEVSDSARMEFNRAPYADIRKLAETLKPEPLAKVVASDLPAGQRAPFAVLLAHCGNKEHGKLIRKMIDHKEMPGDQRRELSSLYFAYILLEPGDGWDLVCERCIRKSALFVDRYTAFTALRQAGAERKDLINAQKLESALVKILGIQDMCDFAIEDLRKHKMWDSCDDVLRLFDRKDATPIIRRSILRYALQCPSPRAMAFVNEHRNRDSEWVADVKEQLDLE